MRKGLQNRILANVLALAMAVSGGGAYLASTWREASAEDDNPEFTEILGAEDIDLRVNWKDDSNIGEEHVVQLSKGSIKVKDNGSMRADLSSKQLATTEMGVGINLGNTMEAVYSVSNKNEASVTDFETIWRQPVTTRDYIDCVHSYGINTLRIPVAWSNGDNDDGTYTIRPELLDRVETIANYALDNGMYVIINDHWDNQWWGQFGACLLDENGEKYADTETREAAWVRYERYWTQISERFKNYSDHLIFEGANEELGTRLNDAICVSGVAKGYAKPNNTSMTTVTGNLSTQEQYEMTNRINQKFVEVVRATGGNNASRHLLIAGFNTDIGSTADARFVMPQDPDNAAVSKLFLSVHYYAPTDFALDDATGTYTKKDQDYTKTYFSKLQKFSDAGYGIIIGECGFCNPSGVSGSVTQWFYDTYTEAAKYCAVPVLWDTGAFFDRVAAKINYKDIAIFYNTINGANGSTDVEKETGGAPGGVVDVTLPDYIDKELWSTPGMHAYLFYQTPTWDYRNAYMPLRNLSSGKHTYEYIHAGGSELTASNTTRVTDVQITKNGKYTVALEGISLAGANYFNMLGVSTDIKKSLYPEVTAYDAYIKIDGRYVTDDNYDLVVKADDDYYSFMLINVYPEENAGSYPLGTLNSQEKLKLPSSSIEITFKLKGLDQALDDLAYGEYVNPETGEKIPATATRPTATPPADNVQTGDNNTSPTVSPDGQTEKLKKGASFTSGNYKYQVTKAADSGKGTVTVTGLAKKGKSAKKLSVAASVKGEDGASYTVNKIGSKAFSGAKATSITLNKKITVIPSSAFAKCKKLSSVTFKAKLSKAAKNSFKGCKKKISVKGTAKKANKKLLKKTSYKKFK